MMFAGAAPQACVQSWFCLHSSPQDSIAVVAPSCIMFSQERFEDDVMRATACSAMPYLKQVSSRN